MKVIFFDLLLRVQHDSPFQTQEKMNSDLMIVPVGINYFHHYRPRNRCIINFGNALRVKDYQKRYHENKAKGLIALKDDLTIAMKEQLLIPDKADYNDKKKALNRLNERKGFKELKSSISTNTFDTAKYYSWLGPVANSLTLFNPLSINLVHYILRKKIKEKQFTASLKFSMGLFLSIIWWLLLFVVFLFFTNWKWAILAVFISIGFLILRSELFKLSIPE